MINLFGNELAQHELKLVLTDDQRDILVGTLLGDASIPKQKGNNGYSVKFEQMAYRKDYIEYLYNVFAPFVGTSPKVRKIVGGGAQDRQSFWFRTYRHDSFRFYYQLFYREGRKIVPKIIHRLLTPRGLAHWFMDDGTKCISGYHLCTQGFLLKDQKILISALSRNFQLNCNIHRDGVYYMIYIRQDSVKRFNEIVSPYIIECMRYKLHVVK